MDILAMVIDGRARAREKGDFDSWVHHLYPCVGGVDAI